MRLRSPAEFYIKYLILHPDKYLTRDIKERLLDEGLDFISEAYIDRLRSKLKPPTPFYPNDRDHAPSFHFLINERINGLFHRELAVRTALEILSLPRAKEFVEAMVLVQVPLPAISAYLTRHLGVFCTTEALELYRHYFWNVNLLDSSQMRVLIQLRIDTLADHVPELQGKQAVLKAAYYKDARKIGADLPHSPMAATLAQMRLGIRPGRQELALRMLEARDMAALRATEAVHQDGPGDSQKFLNYANGSRLFEEMLQMVVKPEDQMQEQLRAIALRMDTREVPSIHTLSAGHHTVDLAPTKDLDHDDDELDDDGPDSSHDGA
jgi:hypothetical protein